MPGALALAFYAYRGLLLAAPDLAMRVAVSRAPQTDRALMRDADARDRLITTFVSGLAPGIDGPVADITLFGQPWEIDLNDVTAPVRIWIGLEDQNVPMSAVRALHAALARSECIELPDAGHLWLSKNDHVVMTWLGEMAGLGETTCLNERALQSCPRA